ncbi:hypothetical protein [Bacillus cereus]|nr:hypothetical protein [Bacillus cereus]
MKFKIFLKKNNFNIVVVVFLEYIIYLTGFWTNIAVEGIEDEKKNKNLDI